MQRRNPSVGNDVRIGERANRPVHGRRGPLPGAVAAPAHGGAGTREVDLQVGLGPVPHRDLHSNGHGLVAVHVVVEVVDGGVLAFGKARNAVTGPDLGNGLQLGQPLAQRLLAVPFEQLLNPPLAELEAPHVGADVAHAVLGVADVEEDHLEHVAAQRTRFVELHGRDPDPLLVDLGGVSDGRLSAGLAAHVGPVAGVGDEAQQLVAGEYRGGERDVGEMRRAAAVGVVEGEHVSRAQRLAPEPLEDRPPR